VTYGNDCERLAASAAFNHAGECGTVSWCNFARSCPRGQVCDVRSCLDGASGTCVPRPSGCPAVYAPVCGCDGVTYGNDCERLVADVALDHAGECGMTVCIPQCLNVGTRSEGWYDPCLEPGRICWTRCAGCRAECGAIGSRSEGWYATCSDPGLPGGCPGSGGGTRLIRYDDCG
ncbi:MAG: hypothetical protein QME96_02320, partial [Myxococcota bacterium]|nr:hypothetical protein [Myxococcota bacterium]